MIELQDTYFQEENLQPKLLKDLELTPLVLYKVRDHSQPQATVWEGKGAGLAAQLWACWKCWGKGIES